MHIPQRIVVVAHGSRQPDWALPFAEVLEAMRQQQPGVDARIAYLEFMAPTLAEALLQAAADGLRQVRVVPLFLGRGNHVQRDIGEQIALAVEQVPDLQVRCEPIAGCSAEVISALARHALKG